MATTYDLWTRRDTTMSLGITAIVEYLREQLGLSERQCFETLDALSPPQFPASGDVMVSVSPGYGVFHEEEQAYPSINEDGDNIVGNLYKESTIDVTAYVRTRSDAADHQDIILHDSLRGVYTAERNILRALVGRDIAISGSTRWLHRPLFVQSVSKPEMDDTKGIAWITLTFGVHFGVSLSS